jgi:hypothetical protein
MRPEVDDERARIALVTLDVGSDRFAAELAVAKLHAAGIPTSPVLGDVLPQAPDLARVS